MSYLFVPGLGGLISESASPDPTRALSLTSRGKAMQPQTLSRAWRTGGFIRRLFGLTLEHSTLDRGAELWIASLRETRASPTALPENKRDQTTTAGLSIKSSGSSMACDLIVSSARTYRGTRTDSLKPSSQHWSKWVIALRLEYSQRPKPAEAIDENDCSSWPGVRVSQGGYTRDNGDPEKERLSLSGLAENWPTPRAEDSEQTGAHRGVPDTLTSAARQWQTPATDSFRCRGGDRKDEMGLDQQARLWTTPQAHDTAAGNADRVGRYGTEHGGRNLTDDVILWATPRTISGGAESGERKQELGRTESGERKQELGRTESGGGDLQAQVESWATPTARDFRSPNSEESQDRRNENSERGQQLPNQIADLMRSGSHFSPQGPPIPDGQKSSVTRRTLNPQFVEWLMGWPIGWTDCAPLETASSQWQQLMRGQLLKLVSPRPTGKLF